MSQDQKQAKYRSDYQAPTFNVNELALTFELASNQTKVTQVAQYEKASSTAAHLVLDGVDQTLITVSVNGESYSNYELTDTSLILSDLPDSFELTIITEIDPENNTSLEGLYLSDGAYCTQCEAEGFRKITYFQDRPDVLTTYKVTIIADKAFRYLLSNGNKVDQGELDDGRHFAVWEDPYKKPSYLFALVAGDFDVLHDSYTTKSGREVALALFVDKGNLSKADHAMISLKKAMEWDETRFNLEYDLDIYMIVAVDFFNMGAMENKGLNIFNSKCVLANQHTATDAEYHMIESIIGHEYFHNWTGNRVTCRDWFQLSLKEGLTVFRDQEFSSDLGSRALNRIDAVKVMRTHQFAEDAGPMAHPIRPDRVIEMNNFYTVTVYDKGAEVIRMMHTLLGESGFQKGMQLYFERHDGTAATCDDFVAAMEDASGVNLGQFRLWYSQSGTPRVTASTELNSENNTLTLTLTQVTKATQDQAEKHALHIPVKVELISNKGESLPLLINGEQINPVLSLTEQEQQFVFENITHEPAIVLLEDFSAPCILNFKQTPEQLTTIVKYARSDFSKWDAQQTLMCDAIVDAIASQNNNADNLIALLRFLLQQATSDHALLAELLLLPSFETIAARFEQVDVDRILTVLEQYEQAIANELKDQLHGLYIGLTDDGEISQQSAGIRSLKGVLLHYLAKSMPEFASNEIKELAAQANMTNVLSALRASVLANLTETQSLLNEFRQKWQHDALVLDKWLGLVARQKHVGLVNELSNMLEDGTVDITNPNRVRALISQFAMFNVAQFHAIDGSGYKLLTDLLIKLNSINPQNAARMITPLMGYKRLDKTRQGLIKSQLERLAALENLSPDLYEKVTNALI